MSSPARRRPEPNLSPRRNKGAFNQWNSKPSAIARSAASERREAICRLNRLRLCDNCQPRLIGASVTEVLGGRAAWRREALPNRRLRPPPGAFLVTFWASKKSLAAGAAKSPYNFCRNKRGRRGHGPGQLLLPLRGNSPSAPALRGSSTDACSLNRPLIRLA